MAIGARELSGEIDSSQVMLIRSVVGFAVVTAIITTTGKLSDIQSQKIKLHGTRNLFHFMGQYGWLLGIAALPLAEVFALEFTVPLWTAIIACLWLGEPLSQRKLLSIFLGLIGVVIILKPTSDIFDASAFIVLGAAICYAISHTSTKALASTESPLTILFYMCSIQMPMSLLLNLNGWVSPNSTQWFWLLIIGVTSLTAHFCITKAMQTAEAGVVVILDFLRLPAIGIVGAIAYGEDIDFALFVGALVMLAGNLIAIVRFKRIKKRHRNAA